MCSSIIGTWSFSRMAVEEALSSLERNDDIIRALEKGINVVEDDPKTGKYVVGRGGFPNENGILECDAAIMDGRKCRFGAVAALQGVAKPFSVARLVMEHSPHSILVGEGAKLFATQQGIPILSNMSLQTENSLKAYQEYKHENMKSRQTASSHDTIGLLLRDFDGNIAAGTSTSGKPFKSCGRVGDSPLPGAGLYADNEGGAAAATGDGDNILRFCPCFHVVQLMKKHNMSPKNACRTVIADIWKRVGQNEMFKMALISMNVNGDIGVASTVEESSNHYGKDALPGFAYSIWNSKQQGPPKVVCEPPIVFDDVY
ncbi:N(4)-(Beta-N-acetylglucosaminyl)-L-asparaginase-like [Xenia sp. Carnegie-2017]|uniref:N(4)-(Beta-N-acetylglucosaminyl)-L-asparaginase- like n=1 Tax=Xenia sp. Carnegie-2017 TaxID=2897299 RepID=UPI001F041AB9|nr:N(4)-(Beta-N-acetylglucosaminyl)-L-asparaginase-like [Xenia sp. Carnegie-2017]